jgi:flavin reductase (DIM6/NTAB) family NADH-FMN oxidoreductase RutF
MQRSGAATRQFYAVFYQWTVRAARAANPTRRCAGNTLVSMRKQSTGYTTRSALEETTAAPVRNSKKFIGSKKLLQREPIQSTADRPTGSLELWDHTIRERSEDRVTVEISVPRWVLRVEDITKRAEILEVRMSTPLLCDDAGDNDLCVVVLSGRSKKVDAIWRNLFYTALDSSNTSSAPTEPIHTEIEDFDDSIEKEVSLPEVFWQPIGKKGAIEYLQTRFGARVDFLEASGPLQLVRVNGSEKQVREVDNFLERIRTWTLSRLYHSKKIKQPEKKVKIWRHSDLPSESLHLWQSVTRKLLDGQAEEEYCLPELVWRDMAQDGGRDILQARFAIDVEPLDVSADGIKQSVTLKGDVAHVERAKSYFAGFQVQVPELQADQEYLRVHAAAIGVPSSIEGCIMDVKQKTNKFRKDLGTPAAKAEIMQRGATIRMPEFRVVKQSMFKTNSATVGHSDQQQNRRLRQDPVQANNPAQIAAPVAATHSADDESAKRSVMVSSSELKTAKQGERLASLSPSSKTLSSVAVDSDNGSDGKGAKPEQIDPHLSKDMRTALRHITQPVAVVTAYSGDKSQHAARGVTVSSFCAVTLQPVPVISFNIRVPSRTWDAISHSGYLRVHLLTASSAGATAAHAFTLPYERPHEPFEHLERLKGNFEESQTSADYAPRLAWRAAVRVDFVARIMPEKCIAVGDHMIVVAEVPEFTLPQSYFASEDGSLAYGLQRYRQLGSEIKPMDIKPLDGPIHVEPTKQERVVEDAEVNQSEFTDNAHLFERFASDTGEEHVEYTFPTTTTVNVTATDPLKNSDPISQLAIEVLIEPKITESRHDDKIAAAKTTAVPGAGILTETVNSVPSQLTSPPKNIEDLGPSSPMLDEESLRQVLEEPESAYAINNLPTQTATNNPVLAEALNAVASAYHETLKSATTVQSQPTSQAHISPAGQSRSNATQGNSPSSVFSAGKHAWGIDVTSTPTNRKISTCPVWNNMARRYYSISSSDPRTAPIPKKILKTTVADYLCEVPTHRKRWTSLIKRQRAVEKIEVALQKREDISSEEFVTLSEEASVKRCQVSRELALRNAHGLRGMLDKGHVDMVRAVWLESNLERGQAVLLDEAKMLRRRLEDGQLNAKSFETEKAELTRDYEMIDVQLRRMRDLVDDDDVQDEDGGEEGNDWAEEDLKETEKKMASKK